MTLIILLGLLLIAPIFESFLVTPALKHTASRRGLARERSAHPAAGNLCAVMVVAQGKSDLLVTNKDEGYDLHGVLTVKRDDSKSVSVLCHGLCSSCEGTVPRFVSEKLDANTFRQGSVGLFRRRLLFEAELMFRPCQGLRLPYAV